jgi:hypothetical protein
MPSHGQRLRDGLPSVLGALLLCLAMCSASFACPFCSAPSLTLAERATFSDITLIGKWVSGEKGTVASSGKSVIEISDILHAPANLKRGAKLITGRYIAGVPDDVFLVTGTIVGKKVEWADPVRISVAAAEYLKKAPSREASGVDRLKYYTPFLEHSDSLVATDAYGEFANAPYEDIVAAKEHFPRDKIRKWVSDPETPATRIGLYGLLLGLTGDESDIKRFETVIFPRTLEQDGFRVGIDGVMGGYLLLAGERGLARLEVERLKNRHVAFAETYAAMQAVRFAWTYGGERFSKDRLRQSMRTVLDRPEVTDLVIADLSRWQDWSLQPRLMAMYGQDEFNIPSIKRAIVRFMLSSIKAGQSKPGSNNDDTATFSARTDKAIASASPAAVSIAATTQNTKSEPLPVEEPETSKQARRYLDELRKRDPKTVSEAEKFHFVR